MLAGRLSRLAIFGLAVFLALYSAALVLLSTGQRSFLFLPGGAVAAPVLAGAKVLNLVTNDGESLLAWYVAPAPGKPLLLYFHGNGGNLSTQTRLLQALTSSGNGLLAVEYRGYPGSSGSPSEKGLLLDAEAAYAKALALGVPAGRIVVLGQSLGSGVAVALASHREIGAIVLDSPFTSAVAVASRRYWMFPVHWLMRDPFHSDERIGRVTAPLLIVHGTDDPVIPFDFGRSLFDLANQPKAFITVDGAGHLSIGAVLPQVLDWIGKTVRS